MLKLIHNLPIGIVSLNINSICTIMTPALIYLSTFSIFQDDKKIQTLKNSSITVHLHTAVEDA